MHGMRYVLDGFELITKPGLRRFVIIPILINMLLFIGMFFALRHFMSEFSAWFTGFLPAWLHWLSILLWLLFLASYIVVFLYTFVTFANLVSAPFNSFLSEKVELYLTGSIPEPRSLWGNIKDVPRIVGRQMAILGYYLPRALVLLLLFFVPVIQAIAPILFFIFHAKLMALTYIDYPTDNHRIPMRDVRVWLAQKHWVSLGFGVMVLVATMIPVLNFFMMPAAVAAATKCWLEESKS